MFHFLRRHGSLALRCVSVISSATLATAPAAAETSGAIDLRVRDSATGYAISAIVEIDGPGRTNRSWQLDESGRIQIELAEGGHPIFISARGYQGIESRLQVDPAAVWPVTVWLDPEQIPAQLRPESLGVNRVPGSALIHGYAVDAQSGEPLAGVEVSLNGNRAQTDASGYFSFNVAVPSPGPESPPESGDLLAERAGYQSYLLANTPIAEGDSQLLIEMNPGEGTQRVDDTHKLMRSPEELEQSQSAPGLTPDREPRPNALDDAAMVSVPPASIRVGYSCSCTACSTVEVMSLETYVKRGLPREWIASWRAHSLRAGAIAYRSYGSWYVYHPLRANYDICNTTCCQVNSTSTSASTNSAVEYTAGILLQRSGSVFRAEYSAENNNLCGTGCSNSSCTCGDGNAGSPGASWPCVSEPYDAGHACAGHGRGMCQWGTQRGALLGQLWNWIEDHYYNNNGSPGGLRSAYMTSPLDIASVGPDPAQVSAGAVFTVYMSVLNYAELPHDQVMLGASLYSDATGYISDSSNDQKVTAYPGSTDVSRAFTVPDYAPSGTYDLLVALWLDVDEDSAITGADLLLVSYLLPGAITVM